MLYDYIAIMINAVFTGLGVAIGQEVHGVLKKRRAEIIKLKKEFGITK
jgi:hypothetical protein